MKLTDAAVVYVRGAVVQRAYLGTQLVGRTRTNYAHNPSFETNQNGWNPYSGGTGGTYTTSRPATGGQTGAGFYRGTMTAKPSTGAAFTTSSALAQTAPYVPGQTQTHSVYVRPSVACTVTTVVQFYTRATTTLRASSGTASVVCPAGVWTRVPVTGSTADPLADCARLSISTAVASGPFVVGSTLDVDGYLAELSPTADGYFDGTTPRARWVGTPHNGYSTLWAPAA